MWYPRRGVEFGVNAMTSPCRNNTTVLGLGVCLDGLTKVSERGAGLHELYCLFQALPCRFNHSDRVCVSLSSIADVVSLVEVSVMTVMI